MSRPARGKMNGVMRLALAALVMAQPLAAQRPRADVPAIVTRGLDAYRTGGVGAAADVWLVGSPMASDAMKTQLVGALAPLEAVYGHAVGSDVIDVVPVSPHVRRVYVVVRLEHGPLYGYIECYETADGAWIIPTLYFNAKASEVLPPRLLGG